MQCTCIMSWEMGLQSSPLQSASRPNFIKPVSTTKYAKHRQIFLQAWPKLIKSASVLFIFFDCKTLDSVRYYIVHVHYMMYSVMMCFWQHVWQYGNKCKLNRKIWTQVKLKTVYVMIVINSTALFAGRKNHVPFRNFISELNVRPTTSTNAKYIRPKR